MLTLSVPALRTSPLNKQTKKNCYQNNQCHRCGRLRHLTHAFLSRLRKLVTYTKNKTMEQYKSSVTDLQYVPTICIAGQA